ncbi:glycosyl hydrolase family 28-related protein [Chitinophaga vietnamensis]|uniref:glycosyl hydrolase family 28-related protein n=1 Tax=Chitinophaga vietnamensis TaxID=2593957 RepID=UPI0011787B8F|nr:glycosyl hydrolase family 28-related protein [Chitinophaga vietnamensis]
MTVTSIAALKNAGGTSMELRNVLGYYTPGDGGGGDFYWDDTSMETDNRGTVIQANGIASGRWKRVYSGAINVKWFGAKGNGTNDDTAAIQQCLTFSDNVYIDKGDYAITAPVTISNKRITISSAPDGFLNKRFTTGDMITFISCPLVDF